MVKQFIKDRLGTIILFAIVIMFVIWGAFSINEAKQNAITFNDKEYVAPESTVDYTVEGTYVSVAKTDSLELFYNEAKGAIQVKDLKSGYLWKGIVDEEVYPGFQKKNKQWVAYMQSSVTIYYKDLKNRDASLERLFSGKDLGLLEAEFIENGVSVTYGFHKQGIYITVEYVLDGDELVVTIPVDKIREDTKYVVSSVEVLPFFGAAGNEKSGYLFYPDGSGAITTFENVNSRPDNVVSAYYYTYTNKDVTFRNMWDEDLYNRYTASMPVYGIKVDDNAMFCYATEGAENMGLTVNPSGVVVDLNRMAFTVYPRNTYNVNAHSMSTGSGTSATGAQIQRVDKQLIPEDKQLRFGFLSGKDADYSGMASYYREYLIENGLLQDSVESGETLPLALNLLMGTTKEGMVFDEFITMTNFKNVQEILDRLSNAGVKNAEVVLQAWMKGYDEYEYWGPASQLGGKKGLKNLNSYLQTATLKNVYLENGFMFASSDTSKLDEDADVAVDGLDIEISFENMDGVMQYMMNPLAAYKRNNAFLKKLEKYDALGVAYEDVARYVYADFNPNATYTKHESVEQLRELFAATDNSGRDIATNGSNQYAYSYTDYIYGIREEAYGLSITDYSVPFTQLVLSGMIPYSTEGAGNLAYDLQTQKLKWIENGALPYFYLTYESALKLRDTDYDTLFSSTYADWEQTVVDTYKEFEANLSCVYGEQMVDHKIITSDLYRIEYANGIVIYINYANTDAKVDGLTVPAKNYVVVKGGEQ